MALASGSPTTARGGLDELRSGLRAWLAEVVPALPAPASDAFEDWLPVSRRLQRQLHDAGWNRWGWPAELGGRGGDARHRAVLYDELSAAGLPVRGPLEHLEILAPALAVWWKAERLAPFLERLLRGEGLWCQGFSEVDAGSDLTSLRTTARRDGDAYVLDGHKVWTSWGSVAEHCVVLARTGPPADRHRGLSIFFVDLGTDGIEVTPVRQASGSVEFAEVRFDGARVPADRLVGGEGDGWSIALDILSCERAAFAWLRHTRLLARADALQRAGAGRDHPGATGEVLVDLFATRMLSATAVEALAGGRFLRTGATPVKVWLTETEQHLYEVAKEVFGAGLALGTLPGGGAHGWQEDYLFSWATSVYGGTRQMQLNTIARFLLGLPRQGAPADGARSSTADSTASSGDDQVTLTAVAVLAADGAGANRAVGNGVAADGAVLDGAAALRALEWTPRPALDDPEWLEVTLALFRAQGRTLAATPALGALGAHVVGAAGGPDDLSTVLAVEAVAGDGGWSVTAPAGTARATRLVLDLGADGFGVVAAGDLLDGAGNRLSARPALDGSGPKGDDPLDPSAAVRAVCPAAAVEPLALPARSLAGRRRTAWVLAQLCISAEVLGACDAMVALATAYTTERRQFGRPVGSFQAVQHLLAEAEAQRRALEAAVARLFAAGVASDLVTKGDTGAGLLKALAGRSAVRIARRALQALGATGFTWENDLHRYARRALTLDALCGTSEQLAAAAARRLQGRAVPRWPAF